MSTDTVDPDKRRFLTIGASVVGGAGVAAAAVPFVLSLQPSEKTKSAGAPIEVDLSKIQPGQRIIVEWRGKPVWIVRRTPEMLATLPEMSAALADPNSENIDQQPSYVTGDSRALKDEYLIMLGICTHLGCSPTFMPVVEADWKGGFLCPCHGSKFDLSGRVYKGMPAPDNMPVPPHRYLTESIVQIGVDTEAAA